MARRPKITPEEFTQLFLEHAESIDADLRPRREELAHGVCFYYAYVFRKVLGGKLWTHMIPLKNDPNGGVGHAFPRYEGKFYDGDYTQGVQEWKQIKQLRRDSSKHLHRNQTVTNFTKMWWFDKKLQTTCDRVVAKIKRAIKTR